MRNTRPARVAIAVLCAAVAFACSANETDTCKPGGDHQVVACYGNAPITAAEVQTYLRPAEPVPGRAALPDPRQAALDAALRVRLGANEAERLGIAPASSSPDRRRALAYQTLRRRVIEEQKATAADVSDDEARRYYEQHPGLFNKITHTYCRAIVVDDPARAEALYAELHGASDDAFAAAARASSRHPSAADGGDIGETHRPDADPEIRRLSNDLRHVGELGGPIALSSGGYVLLRATRLEMAIKPFELVSAQVKNHVAHQREEAALAALFDRLRASAAIEVFADQLAAVTPRAAAPPES